ncbi:MAG: hypothetical protein ACFE8N_14720 [Promethearchaeota archaeon]
MLINYFVLNSLENYSGTYLSKFLKIYRLNFKIFLQKIL